MSRTQIAGMLMGVLALSILILGFGFLPAQYHDHVFGVAIVLTGIALVLSEWNR